MSHVTNQKEQKKQFVEKKDKYLTFALGAEEYGLEILKVREIIGYMSITNIPQAPPHVEGVINLRGQVIPIVDLRSKFGMETTTVTDETCIIVVEVSQNTRTFNTGIIVDHVSEVLAIEDEKIEEAPQLRTSIDNDFILGMGKVNDSVIILLDIDRTLDCDAFEMLSTNAAN
jgi:purine-binding chemotaxis protein CheW